MPIIYTCICRAVDGVILTELSQVGGNADQVMQALMERLVEIPEALPAGTRKTFSQTNTDTGDFFGDLVAACTGGYVNMDGSEHFFHITLKHGVYYACISDDSDVRGQQVNFDFLDGLETHFTKEYKESRIAKAKRLGFQKKFLPSLRSKMHYFNVNHTKLARDAKVQTLLNKIEDMKSVLDSNIRLVLRNQEEQLDEMVERSSEMKRESVVFKKRADILLQSNKRKQKMRCFVYGIFGVACFYLLLAAGCGFTFSACRVRQSSSGEK
eukprot:CAMPEP_0119009956 /NCGR_PEP_ID=MMETSP1176-20130426/4702_1 /TAXON_ID=265551 /ORGANISM="Synedropsis recta cf, Strain CCMP1620" /LENGTH=267 /DNA_ID=CAMNT_0006962541 /DNA_START=67 /DNA_END=870 /DNA_ORIENTATION=-